MKVTMPAQLAPRRSSSRKAAVALAIALVLVLGCNTAGAQVLVASPTITAGITASNHADSALSYARQGLEYAKQLEQYEVQLQQYEQMVMKVRGLGSNVSIIPNNLQPINDPASLIAQNCPNASGSSIVAGVVTSIASAFSPGDSITKSQQTICAKIVTLQVDKYNKTVIILNELNKYGGTLQQLNDLANQVTNVGNASNTTSQAETVSATMARSMSDWQTSIAGDDALISSLNQQQQILAKVALNGSPLGNVVQGAAFALAFGK